MIYTLREEIHVLILLIIYGIYISSAYDIVALFYQKIKIKKIWKICLEIFFWVVQIYIAYLFSYKIQDGYIPLYFSVFVLLGALIYLFLTQKHFKKIISYIYKGIDKLLPRINHELKSLFLPKWFSNYILTIGQFFKKRFKDNKYRDDVEINNR